MLKQILPAGNSLSRKMVGISGESSIFFLQGFYTTKVIYDPFGPDKFLKATKIVLAS